MNALPNKHAIRGNLKLLMAAPLLVIASLYYLNTAPAADQASLDPLAVGAVAAALTADSQREAVVEQVVVTAQRELPFELELDLHVPRVNVAVNVNPPAVQRDPS